MLSIIHGRGKTQFGHLKTPFAPQNDVPFGVLPVSAWSDLVSFDSCVEPEPLVAFSKLVSTICKPFLSCLFSAQIPDLRLEGALRERGLRGETSARAWAREASCRGARTLLYTCGIDRLHPCTGPGQLKLITNW